MSEIQRLKTPIALNDAAPLFVAELKRIDPSATFSMGCFLLALAWNETAAGKSMYNYNWGNISGSFNGNFFRPLWYTLSPDSSANLQMLHAQMLKGKVPKQFAAYGSHAEGVHEFILALYSHFISVVRAARSGNAYDFASAIYTSKYCPDDACRPEKMAASYQSLATQMSRQPALQTLPKAPASSTPGPVEGSSSGSPPSASSESGTWSAALNGADDLPVLKRGSKGAAVALWQALVGITPVDGRFGPVSERETLAYQKAHSYSGAPLTADGVVGSMSWLSVIEILRRQQPCGRP